jgi:hypothetical protein
MPALLPPQHTPIQYPIGDYSLHLHFRRDIKNITRALPKLHYTRLLVTASNCPTAIMSVVSLLGVKVLDNPAAFTDPYKFEITFECLEQLRHGRNHVLRILGHQH